MIVLYLSTIRLVHTQKGILCELVYHVESVGLTSLGSSACKYYISTHCIRKHCISKHCIRKQPLFWLLLFSFFFIYLFPSSTFFSLFFFFFFFFFKHSVEKLDLRSTSKRLLTSSLPQSVRFPSWKMHGQACKQSIFWLYYTSTFNAMRFDENAFTWKDFYQNA